MNQSCIFCKIIQKVSPSTIIKETDELLVIKDIAPKAPIHYLIIPKKHIVDLKEFESNDTNILTAMMLVGKELAQSLPEPKSFRLVINNGKEAGQCVFHAHIHFLAGSSMPSF